MGVCWAGREVLGGCEGIEQNRKEKRELLGLNNSVVMGGGGGWKRALEGINKR